MDELRITERQYQIIIRQAIENLPCETGGFLGGNEDMVKGVLPVFNKTIGDSTKTFTLEPDDFLRARTFFEKHDLEYYGVYHTHPKGVAEPSDQDLKHYQRYLFIISLINPQDPVFAAYETRGRNANKIPIKIVDNKGITVLDLTANQGRISETSFLNEALKLEQLYQDIANEKAHYERLAPIDFFNSNTSFSAFA
ncbi:MAG: Mov34/MPN/PAD-1 family protein [Candidatus Margulisiibacteriota bacterium]|jgi:proteasome lid subunit RPN8/RPN11